MRRLWRWLFNFAAGVSLVLCVGIVVVSVRSYSIGDLFYSHHYFVESDQQKKSDWFLLIGAGGIGVEHKHHSIPSKFSEPPESGWKQLPPAYPLSEYPYTRSSKVWYRLGFAYWRSPWSMGAGNASGYNDRAVVPMWSIAGLFGLLPCAWLWKLFRRRKLNGQLCSVCGYDMRATPDRCPECGTLPEVAKGAMA